MHKSKSKLPKPAASKLSNPQEDDQHTPIINQGAEIDSSAPELVTGSKPKKKRKSDYPKKSTFSKRKIDVERIEKIEDIQSEAQTAGEKFVNIVKKKLIKKKSKKESEPNIKDQNEMSDGDEPCSILAKQASLISLKSKKRISAQDQASLKLMPHHSQIQEESKESEQPNSGLNGIKSPSKGGGEENFQRKDSMTPDQIKNKDVQRILLSQISEHLDADFVHLQCCEFFSSGIDPRYIKLREAKFAMEGFDPIHEKSEQLDPGEYLDNLQQDIIMVNASIIGQMPLLRLNDNKIK
ncbi:hypothetical protein FGO68_gene6245 [Halteria grandinella]|uniref:Uncharacterized protein n=1 Tax=Halteria grandinella TaxID=5974 RepID=A0A8J8T6G3_HALGN|nr:hypothetical protein FGO68_gene6245 [Halteria grandinella]